MAGHIDSVCRPIHGPDATRDWNNVSASVGRHIHILSVSGPPRKASSDTDLPLRAVRHPYDEVSMLGFDAGDAHPFAVGRSAANFDHLRLHNASQTAPILLNPGQVVRFAGQLPTK